MGKAIYGRFFMETTVNTVNYGLKIAELSGGIKFGTDSLLLSYFCPPAPDCADLGAGSGIIGLLLLASGKVKSVKGVEIKPEYARLAEKNAKDNGFGGVYSCECADVCSVRGVLPAGSFSLCVSNPPYLPAKSGIENPKGLKHAAFHETTADINAFCAAASYLLKYGGRFCCVYRPEYTERLIAAARSGNLALKRMRFVHPDISSPPSLVLVEMRKGGKSGASVMRPLIVYTDESHKEYTKEMLGIVSA